MKIRFQAIAHAFLSRYPGKRTVPVLAHDNLPTRLPWALTAVSYLLLQHWNAAWGWYAAIYFVLFWWWLGAVSRIWLVEAPLDLLGPLKGTDVPDTATPTGPPASPAGGTGGEVSSRVT